MRLAEFILGNVEPVLVEWEAFARVIWPGNAPDPMQLRDDAEAILRASVGDMLSEQSALDQSNKSKGRLSGGALSLRLDHASEKHALDRLDSGFDLSAVVAEYRALRASVIRLWRDSTPEPDARDLADLTRFHEAIDQSLTEAVRSYMQAYERERAALLTREQVSRMVAERANRAKDLFLATLSHEMRTPLSAIVGWVRILQFPGLRDTDLTEGLTVIDRNVKAQVQLINDILDVSRIVSGKLHLEFAPCDLTEIVGAGIDAVRAAATARGITVNVQHDPETNPVECDAVRIQQVVWNLMSNAVKFTARGGRVDVALRRDPLTYRIQVRDNGQGISSELLPHIFDRFRQADSSSRRQYGGLGLGLSIVKHIVEQHGGLVEARSDGPGQGATFVVRLPFVAVQLDEYGTPTVGRDRSAGDVRSPTPLTTPSKPVRLDGLRVLVVDDEIDSLRLLVRVLERVGAVVTSACSAAEAMIRLSESEPEVLVSDLGMPGEDGIDLIRKVRASGFHAKDLPAIALTAFAHKQEQERSLSAGYQVHVVKPVEPDELTFVIAGLVDRIGESAP